MVQHTVFGPDAPPWGEPAEFSDGAPSILTGSAFYSTATPWFVVGGRLRVPPGATLPATVTFTLRVYPYETSPDFGSAPVRTSTVAVVEGWTIGAWAPYPLAPAEVAWITTDLGVNYVFSALGFPGPFQAVDGSDLYLAEADTQWRSAFRIGAGATTSSANYYGADVVVDDGSILDEVAISGVAALAATGEVVIGSDASLSALVALTATGVVSLGSGATLTATGAVTATGSVDAQVAGSVTIAGVASIIATGVVTGSFPDWCEPLTVEVLGPDYTVGTSAPDYTVEVRTC